MKKKALGKGLGALIPEIELREPAPREIDIDRITPNPDQPRFRMDEPGIEELAASIRSHGVLQPVLVRPHGEGYQLIAGERRLLAAQRAGLLKIPAVVRDVPDDQVLLLALVENIQREQLNPIEEAQAYQRLLEHLQATQEQVAASLGKERSTVANALRLLKLPPPVRQMVAEGRLSPGHARALLASEAGGAELTRIARIMSEQGWSVRDAERWARNRSRPKRARPPADPDMLAAADRLRLLFGTRVEIVPNRRAGGGGTIKIHYHNNEDLERIYDMLTAKQRRQGVRHEIQEGP
jgi:ParB family chromosome partitioning protein